MNRTVAIVGRPNVGKSRLFNRLAQKRISIVHDQPGITRDVISTEIADGAYVLLDTGGLGLAGDGTSAEIAAAVETQVDFAIEAAGLVLLVVDGLAGVTPLDEKIAARLRRGKTPVRLVVNKADFDEEKVALAECYRLGLGEPLCVSAEHGRGEDDLRAAILESLGPVADEAPGESSEHQPICICFIGRPNVGKSSLSNRLLKSERLIVSDVPGTTRDAVELPFEFRARNGRSYPFRLIDTAGIKAASKVGSPVEYFSRLRSIDAIQRADVVLLVLDALEGVTQQDQAIAGEALRERKPIVVVVNKWDLVHRAFKEPEGLHHYATEREYREKYTRALNDRLFFTPGAPVIFVSAQSGYEMERMLNAAVKLHRTLDKKLPTGPLNRALARLTERTLPPIVGLRRFRVYYATQTGRRPFRIRLFCNREDKLPESYRRYLEAGLIEEFKLEGCPIYFELVGKERREGGPSGRGRKSSAGSTHGNESDEPGTLED